MEWVKVQIAPDQGGEICDFCASPDVYAAYGCESFAVKLDDKFVSESRDGWSACKICSEMIDRERWADLLDRSVDSFALRYGLPYFARHELKREISQLHAQFRAHRKMQA